ncbi:hypothetical protein M1N12_02690 [Peptococcaceae bacterium]|nr:hypothetical protein [Peptococcaceae bacterium]
MYPIVWICFTNMVAIPLLYLLYESRFGEYAISYVVFVIGMGLSAIVLGTLVEIILMLLINWIFFKTPLEDIAEEMERGDKYKYKTMPAFKVIAATNGVVGVIWFVVLVEHYGLFERFGLWTPGISDYLPETVKEWMVNGFEFYFHMDPPGGWTEMEKFKYLFPPPSP